MSADMKHDRIAGRFAMTDSVIGPYRIIEEIDSGGMAHVYRAEDRHGRFGIVALKVMRAEIAVGTEYQLRFRREAKIWSELDHENIVPLLDYSTSDLEGAYVAMRYIQGCSLHDLLAERGALPIDYAIPIIKDILSAVEYAHKKKVIHRDIKPDNVLLDSEGKAYLTDWGIAKPLGATELTNTGARLGTPTYMSPEQIRGKKDVSARADIYALGVLIYEILTGKPPFQSDDAIVLGHAHCYEEPTEMKRRGAPFPELLQNLVMKCLEKEVKSRPRSVSSMLKTIKKVEKNRAKGKQSRKRARSSKGTARVEATIEELQEQPKREEKKSRSLVIAPARVKPLSPPRLPVAAFLRVAVLLFIGALVAGFATPQNLMKTIFNTLGRVHSNIERLWKGQLSADAVEMLEDGNPRLALLSLERNISEDPSLKSEVLNLCWKNAQRAYRRGNLLRAELLAAYCVRLRPKSEKIRFFLARVLMAGGKRLAAGKEYVRAHSWLEQHELLEHLENYGDVLSRLAFRERRLIASRYYQAARHLLLSENYEFARPYLLAALRLSPNDRVYKEALKPPPTAPPLRMR